jgi:hypothetical protein
MGLQAMVSLPETACLFQARWNKNRLKKPKLFYVSIG